MNIWEEILGKYDNIFNNLPGKGKGNLRFGRSLVSISNIAEQYYCEQKLDLESEYPMPPTEQMKKGEEGHEAAATLGAPVSKSAGWRFKPSVGHAQIEAKKLALIWR